MTESFSFPDQTVEEIKSLKEKFGLKSNAEAISRALTLAKFLADKSGDENIVVVVGEDGPTKLNLAK